ncbi:MAG: hypothetical protein FAZ92_00854 [Accumulibacter sp.]|uniref:hypothetical protein n=1 Tax=Accumulibacter sp. TaxID=2053492 RepID=UPI0012149194|nr:hypothetical protein [Accumulibacter sp.]QKS27803.1 MAG: hypothetical protein HT579_01815 [Candidatus Accumulibacter similis]TLD46862.1 MAG: hypothetical protein FAZ92_00854 [Accumulibacter sp.]
MRTPMLLPWLASRARVSEARAAILWREAMLRAEETTGERETSCYWGAALATLQELLALERWRPQTLMAWPWLVLQGGIERGSWFCRHWLSPGLLSSTCRAWRLSPVDTPQ